MIYQKPKNMTYSQLCQWIDENYYKEDCDEYLLYTYLYVIINMLAKKERLFRSVEDYDNFSIFTANKVFFRLIKYKNKEEKRIHYILPYIKKIFKFSLADFLKEFYVEQKLPPEQYIEYSFKNLIKSLSDDLWIIDFKNCLENISGIINNFFKKIPKKKNSSEWLNLKTSVILTVLNRLTLPDKEFCRLKNLSEKDKLSDDKLEIAYNRLCEHSDIILIGLDEKYRNLVSILSEELVVIFEKELYNIIDNPIQNDYLEFISLFS